MTATQLTETRHFSARTALTTRGEQLLGAMVRTATELWVYWQGAPPRPTLRVQEVSGFPIAATLDGTGLRDMAVTDDATDICLQNLLPGRLYMLHIGDGRGDDFKSILTAGPVLTGDGAP